MLDYCDHLFCPHCLADHPDKHDDDCPNRREYEPEGWEERMHDDRDTTEDMEP